MSLKQMALFSKKKKDPAQKQKDREREVAMQMEMQMEREMQLQRQLQRRQQFQWHRRSCENGKFRNFKQKLSLKTRKKEKDPNNDMMLTHIFEFPISTVILVCFTLVIFLYILKVVQLIVKDISNLLINLNKFGLLKSFVSNDKKALVNDYVHNSSLNLGKLVDSIVDTFFNNRIGWIFYLFKYFFPL